MAVKVVEYTKQHETAVRELNRRLREGGWKQQFPESATPGSLPRGAHPDLYNEMFVAIDDGGAARGGYILKHQAFMVAGERRSVANYAFPLSEGVVDRRHGMVGVTMIVDAQKRNPLLYGLGMGGLGHPSVRVMRGVGWSACMVPFFFRVLRPVRFLRNIAYLRRSRARRLLLDAAAFSGAGWLGVCAWNALRRRVPNLTNIDAEVVPAFGSWADDVWASVERKNGIAAVRDRAVLDALYPPGSRCFVVKVSQGGSAIGWAVGLATQMTRNDYFGDLRVGTFVDCFARPGAEPLVAAAADRELARRNVDLVISNQSAREWGAALTSLGYREGPSNFALTCSRKLVERIGRLDDLLPQCHVNRGDGDGPIHL